MRWMLWWGLLACGAPRAASPTLALEGSATRGEPQYQMVCARCHGARGGGMARSPALAGAVHALSDEVVVDVMLNGRGAMGGQRVTDQQAADILAYLRQAFPSP